MRWFVATTASPAALNALRPLVFFRAVSGLLFVGTTAFFGVLPLTIPAALMDLCRGLYACRASMPERFVTASWENDLCSTRFVRSWSQRRHRIASACSTLSRWTKSSFHSL